MWWFLEPSYPTDPPSDILWQTLARRGYRITCQRTSSKLIIQTQNTIWNAARGQTPVLWIYTGMLNAIKKILTTFYIDIRTLIGNITTLLARKWNIISWSRPIQSVLLVYSNHIIQVSRKCASISSPWTWICNRIVSYLSHWYPLLSCNLRPCFHWVVCIYPQSPTNHSLSGNHPSSVTSRSGAIT